MGISPKREKPIRVPAFRAKFNREEFFLFMANPKELLPYCYVARRERGLKEFYQRIIKPRRIRDVADYIKEGGFFPNNAIVSLHSEDDKSEEVKFIPQKTEVDQENDFQEFGLLQFPSDFRSIWVIDGQHRCCFLTP